MAAAAAVLDEMRAVGVAPNYVTYTTLIDGWVRLGKIDEAQRMLDVMLVAGEQPNVVTFNSLLKVGMGTACLAARQHVCSPCSCTCPWCWGACAFKKSLCRRHCADATVLTPLCRRALLSFPALSICRVRRAAVRCSTWAAWSRCWTTWPSVA
jgi:pentatricopeptide repeat protein